MDVRGLCWKTGEGANVAVSHGPLVEAPGVVAPPPGFHTYKGTSTYSYTGTAAAAAATTAAAAASSASNDAGISIGSPLAPIDTTHRAACTCARDACDFYETKEGLHAHLHLAHSARPLPASPLPAPHPSVAVATPPPPPPPTSAPVVRGAAMGTPATHSFGISSAGNSSPSSPGTRSISRSRVASSEARVTRRSRKCFLCSTTWARARACRDASRARTADRYARRSMVPRRVTGFKCFTWGYGGDDGCDGGGRCVCEG
jgi:hypothetical protein